MTTTATAIAPQRGMTGFEWGLLGLLALIWGGSFFLVEIALRELAPLTIVACRVGLAALALQLWLTLAGRRGPQSARLWAAFAVMGLLNNALPFTLIISGQLVIASGLAAILNATTPIFGVLAAQAFTANEKLTAGKAIGVGLGFLGVALLVGPEALAGLGADGAHLLAELAVLGAALSYGCAGVFGRRFRRLGVAPIEAAAGQVTASTLIVAPLALMVDRPFATAAPGPETVAAVIAMALLATAVAYVLYFRILAGAGATNVLLVTLLVPPVALALGAAFLDERVGAADLGGLGLIGLGLAAIDGRALAALRRTPRRHGR